MGLEFLLPQLEPYLYLLVKLQVDPSEDADDSGYLKSKAVAHGTL